MTLGTKITKIPVEIKTEFNYKGFTPSDPDVQRGGKTSQQILDRQIDEQIEDFAESIKNKIKDDLWARMHLWY